MIFLLILFTYVLVLLFIFLYNILLLQHLFTSSLFLFVFDLGSWLNTFFLNQRAAYRLLATDFPTTSRRCRRLGLVKQLCILIIILISFFFLLLVLVLLIATAEAIIIISAALPEALEVLLLDGGFFFELTECWGLFSLAQLRGHLLMWWLPRGGLSTVTWLI